MVALSANTEPTFNPNACSYSAGWMLTPTFAESAPANCLDTDAFNDRVFQSWFFSRPAQATPQ